MQKLISTVLFYLGEKVIKKIIDIVFGYYQNYKRKQKAIKILKNVFKDGNKPRTKEDAQRIANELTDLISSL